VYAGIALIVFGPALAAQDDPADKAAFETVCTACHSSALVSDLKSEPEWIETVDRMVSIGAKATEEQLDRVLRYLARHFTKANINIATAQQIAPVLDVSETAAKAVADYRAFHGGSHGLAADSGGRYIDPHGAHYGAAGPESGPDRRHGQRHGRRASEAPPKCPWSRPYS
jgi:hypothetical protein